MLKNSHTIMKKMCLYSKMTDIDFSVHEPELSVKFVHPTLLPKTLIDTDFHMEECEVKDQDCMYNFRKKMTSEKVERLHVDSDDSVFDRSNQNMMHDAHPAYKIIKLRKRIIKDRKISDQDRKNVIARRNTLFYRNRVAQWKEKERLITKILPAIQKEINLADKTFPKRKLVTPKSFDQNKGKISFKEETQNQ